MSKTVVIGRGEMENGETMPFDRRIVELAGNEEPRALYIPTAGGESKKYIEIFHEVYGEKLGCETDTLYLLDGEPEVEELGDTVLSSDLIYVGGGDTRKMRNVWRETGVDEILKEAYQKDIVLSGISAGGICWFEGGHNDSERFEKVGGFVMEDWNFIEVGGLGLLEGIYCPHFNKEERRESFPKFVAGTAKIGIVIEDECAMEFSEESCKVLSKEDGGKAYRIYNRNGEVVTEELIEGEDIPLGDLYRPRKIE